MGTVHGKSTGVTIIEVEGSSANHSCMTKLSWCMSGLAIPSTYLQTSVEELVYQMSCVYIGTIIRHHTGL